MPGSVAQVRAAAAALCGRQVALLAPTTLLARQHLEVFRRRFAGFGVRVNTDFGPIRMDLGFNLDPQQFREDIPRERRMVFHISIGQAF